jgi:hypothetical protein
MLASKIVHQKHAADSVQNGWLKIIEFKIGLQKLEKLQATIER